jgi:hypothetical protein
MISLAAQSAQSTAQPPAQAQSAEDPAIEEVVVTGRMPPGAVIGDISPENQLSPRDIASYGVSTINDLLSQISEQTQSDQGRDSSAAPIILVNGKRVSGVTEVGDLPTESILRVDILPEEVALKYGYGAQQKVVNIILRRNFLATVVDLNGGESTAGGGENGMGDLNYSRIHDNDRVNVVGRVKTQAAVRESDRGVSSTAGTISDPTGAIVGDNGNDSDARTLKPATNSYTLNAVVAHPLSDAVAASFNAMAGYQTSRALDGLPAANLRVPASSPYAQDDVDTTLDRYLSDATLRQRVDTATAHAGLTLNADLPKQWRFSAIGNYDYSDARTRTDRGYDVSGLQAAIDAGSVDPYGPLSASTLGSLRRQDASAITNTGSASVLANGALFKLPAGDIATSLRFGGDFSSLASSSTGETDRNSTRTQVSGQVSVDVPLTSSVNHVFGALGDLSANVTGAVTQVSGYGALGTLGYGLHWTPYTGVSLLATVNEDHQVPTLAQLNGPLVTTSNVRLYDYVQGQTVTVTETSGGNPDLKADDRHVFKLGASWAAIAKPTLKLNLTASYIDSVTRNAIGSLSSATAATEAAFPDHFERDDSGQLVDVDDRAVNFAREERHDLRWGFNLTKVLRAPTRPPRPQGAGAQGYRNRPRAAGDGQGQATAATAANTPDGAAAQSPTGSSQNAPSPAAPPQPGAPPNDQQEVVVTGERPSASTAARPPLRRDGMPFDGPPGVRGGFPEGGPRPGGGFGGPGGRGGGPPGGFGGGNGAQLDVSLYHSWYFRDDVRLAAGSPAIDLLNGGTIGSVGQARHKVQLNAGVIDNGIGLRFSGSWTSPVSVIDSGGGSGALYYSSLATLDVRLFADLQQRFMGKPWARGTRVTLAFTNVFNSRQNIRNGNGVTPQIYQPAFLDPYGRTIGIGFRRLF